jgi:hypothetical protein
MRSLPFFVLICLLLLPAHLPAAGAPVSDATSECLDCHASVHPGIVHGWQSSRHAAVTPQEALTAGELARKVSNPAAAELPQTVIGCAECHTLRPEAHADTFEHNGYQVHVVVSPDDCKTCHLQEVEQFTRNLMANAYDNLAQNSLYHALENSIIGKPVKKQGRIEFQPSDPATRAEACYYCHGTKLAVNGTEVRDTESAGELEFPVISGWPNQGVGRINLDGSKGSCTACHTRHTFSIVMARKPYTCQECHVGPDVPVYKVYASSKHGNIFSTLQDQWDFKPVPWTVGRDFTAPTCAACHMSLLVDTDGSVIQKRSHQINDRLPWRLFGLVYAHPYPRQPDTTIIRNKDGQPLPTDFEGGWAEAFLIDPDERAARSRQFQRTCLTCHDTSWVQAFWARFENTIATTNAATRTATQIMQSVWQAGLADATNPFDEPVERLWSDVWLFHANTVRFASSMGGGGDYGVFADGQYQLSQRIVELNEWLEMRRPKKE